MPAFDELKTQLADARSGRDAAEREVAIARDELARLEAQRGRLSRSFDQRRPADGEARRKLAAEIARLEQALARAREAVSDFRAREIALVAELEEHTDPRKAGNYWNERAPVLLLPYRVETRFHVQGATHQLWVRVYPDVCAVDSFEETLSEAERVSARRYWEDTWRASGNEPDERAAWRALVGSHGSGRGGWIVANHRPLNPDEAPAKTLTTDVILVISTEVPLAVEAERTALAQYWADIWTADANVVDEAAALQRLVAAVGQARAAELIEKYAPFNLADRPPAPLTRAEVTVTVAYLVLPADVGTSLTSWNRAPRVHALPDRFVVIASSGPDTIEHLGQPIPSPLVVGPDPSAPESEAIHGDDGNIVLPEELRWTTDFQRSVDWGMGFRVPLTLEQYERGVDQLVVLGVRLTVGADGGRELLESLLLHHRDGPSGLSLVPQGTPTNNTEAGGAGFSNSEDADATFALRGRSSTMQLTADPDLKRDGQWLAELLGVDPAIVAAVSHADGTDQLEARAMARALWPATGGYFLDSMMHPLVSPADADRTRQFFTGFVSGRGWLPAIRIAAQPYGILPATAFSRIASLGRGDDDKQSFLPRLYALLRRLDATWSQLTAKVSYVGKSGDPHQILLDVLGLHPASVEFSSRYAESIEHIHNYVTIFGIKFDLGAVTRALRTAEGAALLGSLGYGGQQQPDILRKVFLEKLETLTGPVIDDRPLSETDPVRVWTTDGLNYLQQLVASARTSLEMVRTQPGYIDETPPRALLYLLLRHGLLLGYHDAALRFYASTELRTPAQILELKREPAFVHVAGGDGPSESRWGPLFAREASITGSPERTVADHVRSRLGQGWETDTLTEQISAIERLAQVPTSRLERLLAEHLDCCSYRLDAWRLGLIQLQLAAMRVRRDDSEESGSGTYVGGYAWVENLRPKPRALQRAAVPAHLAPVFERNTESTPLRDPTNGGYIHAPSLNHALTAAVLRSGYLANATAANPETLAVDLSSERVRLALGMLDGMRTGQGLDALLGYRIQRALHDRYAVAEMDEYIHALREVFPLRANRLESTKESAPVDELEAQNVIDGLALVEQARAHLNEAGHAIYPFGEPRLPGVSQAVADILGQEVDALIEIHDALGDLGLAEAVHQAAQGNLDRAAGSLDTFTKGNHPPDPMVVRTPLTGAGITHRIGVHFQPGLAAPAGATPRAVAEPALDQWLERVLPPLDDIACTVVWRTPQGAAQSEVITLAQLGYRPIDVLHVVRNGGEQEMRELDDRIITHVLGARTPRADAELSIRYMDRPAGKISVFEVMPLITHLRSCILGARSLRASDVTLEAEATTAQDADVFVDRARIAPVLTAFVDLQADVATYLNALRPLVADVEANRAALLAGIDGLLDDATALLARAAWFAMPEGGWGFAFDWRRRHVVAILTQVRELIDRWDEKLADTDSRLTEEGNLPGGTPVEERLAALWRAELAVSTTQTPPPVTRAALRSIVVQKRDDMQQRRDELEAVVTGAGGSAADLLASVAALLPIDAFDPAPFTLNDAERRVLVFALDLERTMAALSGQIAQRSAAAQNALDAHDAAPTPAERVAALEAAAHALLGDDFRLLPEFTLSQRQGDEWQNALDAFNSGELFTYLVADLELDLPVDEWLAGVARVRAPLHAWEQAGVLAGGFGRLDPPLTPIQLPYRPDDRWLALQIPDDYDIDGGRLLYTAHYGVPFDRAARQCGLLLDEWTEVIPGGRVVDDGAGNRARDQRETTGLAFHFDRPSSEAPQAMLLVTPATWDGRWSWADLVDAVLDSFQMAKQRAVEPRHLAETPLARLLPATVMAAARKGISITTPLAINNNVYSAMELT